MATIGKRLRKPIRRFVRHRFVQDVLEDLVAAALIAAATKFRDGFAPSEKAKPKKKRKPQVR